MSSGREQTGSKTAAYWNATRRPLPCLVFLTPLLAVYEAGVFWLGGQNSDAVRNGADHWMRDGLEYLGLNQPWLLPVMIVVGLLVWHLARQEPWQFSLATTVGMFAESLLFAAALIVIGQLEGGAYRHWAPATTAAIVSDRTASLAVIYVGAGIYEEVLFRLCLLPICYQLFRTGGMGQKGAAILAILATSLAFSLAHYFGAGGEQFRLFTFIFRTIAGLFFAALFVLRGFGITVGAHAAYDLLVGLVLAGAG
jgi:membrane protease YdiL (CAAX protease family)